MEQVLESLPEELFNTLKCYLCGKYLSVGPVISISDDGKPYKCGRCKDIPSNRAIRNLCYEKVAVYLIFPCSYENCKVKLVWDQVEKHEKFCQHRNIQCVNHGCEVLLRIADFEKHFKSHSDKRYYENVIKNSVVKKYCSTVFLLKCSSDTFFVVIRYCSQIIHVGVFSLQPVLHNTFFELTITNGSPYSPCISYQAEVIEYDELIHCINCMRKKCHLHYHKYSVHYQYSGLNISKLPIEIDSEALEKLLLYPAKLVYSVNVSQKPACAINPQSSNNSESGISEKSEVNFDNCSLGETEELQ